MRARERERKRYACVRERGRERGVHVRERDGEKAVCMCARGTVKENVRVPQQGFMLCLGREAATWRLFFVLESE